MTTDRHYSEDDLDQLLAEADLRTKRWLERGYHEGDLDNDPYYLCAQALRQVRAERDEARAAVRMLRDTLARAGGHLNELRDAWERGIINETDTLGGTRSNRNVDRLADISSALAATAPEEGV